MLKNMLAAGLLAPSVKHKHYVATKKAAKLLFVCKNGFMLDYHHMEEEITGMTAIKVKKDPFAAIDAKFM